MTDEGIRLVAAALALIPLLGVALALGKIFSDWISSVARNPRGQAPTDRCARPLLALGLEP